MKRKLLFLLIVLASCCIMANAATKYQINVGGVEVTSENARYISGGDINPGNGSISYDNDTKTLTVHNASVWREAGSGDYGIHNRGCEGLTIVLKGDCMIYSEKGAGMKLEKNTTIKVVDENGYYITVDSRDNVALDINNNVTLTINGGGELHSKCRSSTTGKPGIKGGGSNSTINFEDAKVSIYSFSGYAVQSVKMNFKSGCDVTFDCSSNVQKIKDCSMTFSGRAAILSPAGAYYSSSGSSVYLDGSPVTNKEIYVSDNYVAILNSTYFPDEKFRNFLLNKYSKGYITSSDVSACQELWVDGQQIYNLQGVGYFSNLKVLNCSSNYLSSLPSLPGTLLELKCHANNLTSLPSLPSNLTHLWCFNNKLTSLPSLPSGIEVVLCYDNKLNSLAISGKNNLVNLECYNNPNIQTINVYNNNSLLSLDAKNCPSLLSLNCSNNEKLEVLDVTGNTGLLKLWCNGNKLSYFLKGLNSCTSLTYLDCRNNQLTSLSDLPESVEELYCGNNQYRSITLKDRSALKTMSIVNNQYLTLLNVSNNSLTTLDVTGCSALRELNIAINKITGSKMSSLISGMRTIPSSEAEGRVLVYYRGPTPEGNVITDAQITSLRNKRWIPLKYVNNELVWMTIKGDVNGAADITALYNWILNGDKTSLKNGYQNDDNVINAGDITTVYNIILGN